MPDWLLILNALATGWMAGVIWLVQLLTYPMFSRYDRAAFAEIERCHQRQISWVVGPAMLIEAVSAAAMLWWRPRGVSTTLLWMGVALVFVWAASTALIQVPAHNRLCGGFDERVHRSLVRWNWIRTAAWSGRLVVVATVVHQRLQT